MTTESALRAHVGIGPDEPWPSATFPGCYPIGYLVDDGEWLCARCMNDPTNPIHFDEGNDGWRVTAADALEGVEDAISCAHCNRRIAGTLYGVVWAAAGCLSDSEGFEFTGSFGECEAYITDLMANPSSDLDEILSNPSNTYSFDIVEVEEES